MGYQDAYQRRISYLRVSVTDRCNLRCVYCMPAEGVPWRPHEEILRFEEITTIVRAAVELGIQSVRLTGGEPLVRPHCVDLARMLAEVPGIDDLSMTTNGTLLSQHADALAEAGLQRVNVSLDTLKAGQYERITCGGQLADALAGIEAARQANLCPLKINTVVIRGLNDDEVAALAETSRSEGWHIRFIELMPIGSGGMENTHWEQRLVTGREIRQRIERALGPLQAADVGVGAGPARTFRLPDAEGTIGFISPISDHCCANGNRLRLTADGHRRPCLLSDMEIDLRAPLRAGAPSEEIKDLIRRAITCKPAHHQLDSQETAEKRAMSEIGG